jgi:predicted nucleotide-binding protein (sugar kinase/HSP70/actin superfamily)
MVNAANVREVRRDDTIFVPPMEPIMARLAAGVFRSLGCRAEVLPEDERTLDIGLKHTAGNECTPCPSTIGSMIATMQDRDLDPDKVIFFMPTTCGPCRFGQYGTLASLAFRRRGWDRIRVLAPSADNSYGGMSGPTRRLLWHAIVVGDVINKVILRLRPYERDTGSVDACAETWIEKFVAEFAKPQGDLTGLMAGFVAAAKRIPLEPVPRPKVGIVGEIYVRHDPFMNKNLVDELERLGAEVLASTIGEWVLYCAAVERRLPRRHNGRKRRNLLVLAIERKWFASVEHAYMRLAHDIIADRAEPPIDDVIRAGQKYVPWEFQTETILTVGKTVLFIERDGVDAVVNASPMFCMPGTISAAIFPKIEREYGVPIISNFYDGSGDPNKSLVPYLHYLRRQ